MTTIAMAAGMMPSALAFGAGGEFRSPMALAVIGGLVFSTLLSLVFVPAMFILMDDLGALIWRFGKKLLASSGENEHLRGRASSPPAPQAAADSAAACARGGVAIARRRSGFDSIIRAAADRQIRLSDPIAFRLATARIACHERLAGLDHEAPCFATCCLNDSQHIACCRPRQMPPARSPQTFVISFQASSLFWNS